MIKSLKLLYLLTALFLLLGAISCTTDNPIIEEDINEVADQGNDDDSGDDGDSEPEDDPDESSEDRVGEVDYFSTEDIEDSYILVNDAGNNRVYIMDKDAVLLHEWSLSNSIGNDVFLLPDGRLLAILEADDPQITFGGKGGKIQLVDKDSNILWNFDYSSEDYILHHDVEMLPNGNIIAMVWEKLSTEDAQAAGSMLDYDIYPEAIIEVDPTTSQIVWEWHAWDHLIQDYDASKANYGVIAENPHLIDLNYVADEFGDIMHGNGISYDEERDVIFLSINYYHEVWAIDHSTSTAEAASGAGGNYGKGGDLVYRFGNPEAYDNPFGDRLFYNNHFPNLLPKQGTDARNMLIFVNQMNGMEQSAVYELEIPEDFNLQANTNNEPSVAWSFTHPELFSPRVSGAVRLNNGNTLITQGTSGYWEVRPDAKVVWRFYGTGFFWRGYDYPRDAAEISSLGL